jgi:dTDP-4-amino-4,6-dideoxygalactose transaminase
MRLEIWDRYHAAFGELEELELLRRPIVPADCSHNAHMYYLLLPTPEARDSFLRELRASDVNAVFHYMPLHLSPAGRRYGRVHGELPRTDHAAQTVVRLPLWASMERRQQDRVISIATKALETAGAGARA